MHRRILFTVVALAVVGVVAVAAATAGPVRTGDPVLPLERLGTLLQQMDVEEAIGDQDDAEARRREPPVSVLLLAVAGALFIVAALVYAFAPVLAGQRIRWHRRPPATDLPPVDVAEQLRRTAQEAADAVASRPSGHARDDVIRCWVQLEHVADEAGTPRLPAQTPSEFTADLLRAHHADPVAVETLLARYHRARFGRAPLPPQAAEDALAALRRIAATVGTETAPADTR